MWQFVMAIYQEKTRDGLSINETATLIKIHSPQSAE